MVATLPSMPIYVEPRRSGRISDTSCTPYNLLANFNGRPPDGACAWTKDDLIYFINNLTTSNQKILLFLLKLLNGGWLSTSIAGLSTISTTNGRKSVMNLNTRDAQPPLNSMSLLLRLRKYWGIAPVITTQSRSNTWKSSSLRLGRSRRMMTASILIVYIVMFLPDGLRWQWLVCPLDGIMSHLQKIILWSKQKHDSDQSIKWCVDTCMKLRSSWPITFRDLNLHVWGITTPLIYLMSQRIPYRWLDIPWKRRTFILKSQSSIFNWWHNPPFFRLK